MIGLEIILIVNLQLQKEEETRAQLEAEYIAARERCSSETFRAHPQDVAFVKNILEKARKKQPEAQEIKLKKEWIDHFVFGMVLEDVNTETMRMVAEFTEKLGGSFEKIEKENKRIFIRFEGVVNHDEVIHHYRNEFIFHIARSIATEVLPVMKYTMAEGPTNKEESARIRIVFPSEESIGWLYITKLYIHNGKREERTWHFAVAMDGSIE